MTADERFDRLEKMIQGSETRLEEKIRLAKTG